MSRDTLHGLIDRIREEEINAARRYLEYLASPAAYRSALAAPVDDEPVTAGDAEAIARSRSDIHDERFASHAEVLREFGLK